MSEESDTCLGALGGRLSCPLDTVPGSCPRMKLFIMTSEGNWLTNLWGWFNILCKAVVFIPAGEAWCPQGGQPGREDQEQAGTHRFTPGSSDFTDEYDLQKLGLSVRELNRDTCFRSQRG